MAGKSGMAWGRIKNPDSTKKLTITLGDGILDYIESVAQSHKWSVSQAAREIILAAKEQKVKI